MSAVLLNGVFGANIVFILLGQIIGALLLLFLPRHMNKMVDDNLKALGKTDSAVPRLGAVTIQGLAMTGLFLMFAEMVVIAIAAKKFSKGHDLSGSVEEVIIAFAVILVLAFAFLAVQSARQFLAVRAASKRRSANLPDT